MMSNFMRTVSHERALEAAHRLANSHFNNNPEKYPHARMSIPVSADDDDIVLCDYIAQQKAREEGVPVNVLLKKELGA